MKKFEKLILFVVFIFSLSAIEYRLLASANAAVPHLINYQGRVTDASGDPLNGAFDLTFRIYDAETAGNLLWQETQAGVVVDKGLFGILLGSVTALDIPFDKAYFLEIKVGTEVMSPRQRITSAGYAIRAEKAESVDGIDPGMVGTKAVDETGLTNGMVPYYDSASGKVKWNTSVVFARVTGSNFQTTSNALVDISGLSVALSANSVYEFEAVITGNSGVSGFYLSPQYSAAGAAVEGFLFGNNNSATLFNSSRISAFNTKTVTVTGIIPTARNAIMKGIVRTGSNAGNFSIQVTAGGGDINVVVYMNSFLKVTKIS